MSERLRTPPPVRVFVELGFAIGAKKWGLGRQAESTSTEQARKQGIRQNRHLDTFEPLIPCHTYSELD
jgi:hypothetical protein